MLGCLFSVLGLLSWAGVFGASLVVVAVVVLSWCLLVCLLVSSWLLFVVVRGRWGSSSASVWVLAPDIVGNRDLLRCLL